MLTLEKNRKENNLIFSDFFFVGDETRGSVVYDVSNGEFIEASYGEKNPLIDFVYGFGYVKYLLDMMVKHNNYPEKVTFEWY